MNPVESLEFLSCSSGNPGGAGIERPSHRREFLDFHTLHKHMAARFISFAESNLNIKKNTPSKSAQCCSTIQFLSSNLQHENIEKANAKSFQSLDCK